MMYAQRPPQAYGYPQQQPYGYGGYGYAQQPPVIINETIVENGPGYGYGRGYGYGGGMTNMEAGLLGGGMGFLGGLAIGELI
ncbi:hypothetical protein WJX73_010934 [Symbiochloris irregularis]|uniref:Uncharacterized protein n=1 Tax=Symbiochloris irregularis TaxID=706552 RepID=A0AAW1P963_9CHLO